MDIGMEIKPEHSMTAMVPILIIFILFYFYVAESDCLLLTTTSADISNSCGHSLSWASLFYFKYIYLQSWYEDEKSVFPWRPVK